MKKGSKVEYRKPRSTYENLFDDLHGMVAVYFCSVVEYAGLSSVIDKIYTLNYCRQGNCEDTEIRLTVSPMNGTRFTPTGNGELAEKYLCNNYMDSFVDVECALWQGKAWVIRKEQWNRYTGRYKLINETPEEELERLTAELEDARNEGLLESHWWKYWHRERLEAKIEELTQQIQRID